ATLAPRDQVGVGVDELEELPDEAALADPRHADERHELGRLLAPRPSQRLRERVELLPAPGELGWRVLEDVDAEARARGDDFPDGNRLRLALRRDGLRRAEVNGGRRRPSGRLV